MDDIGEIFKEKREAMGLNIREVSEVIKVRSLYLAAIESWDLKAMNSDDVYIKGYLRSYSRFLGLDSEDIIKQYIEFCSPKAPAINSRTPVLEESNSSNLMVIISIMLTILIIIISYNLMFKNDNDELMSQKTKVLKSYNT